MDKRKGRRWSKEEVKFIINNYNQMSTLQIANILSRTATSIEAKAGKMNVRKNRRWTKKEEKMKRTLLLGFIFAIISVISAFMNYSKIYLISAILSIICVFILLIKKKGVENVQKQ